MSAINRKSVLWIVLALVALAPGSALVSAAGNPPVDRAVGHGDDSGQGKILQSYDMSWWSVDGGGGSSSGGDFSLTGALGQPDVGTSQCCGVALSGGVWSGTQPAETPILCDGFESGGTGAWTSVSP